MTSNQTYYPSIKKVYFLLFFFFPFLLLSQQKSSKPIRISKYYEDVTLRFVFADLKTDYGLTIEFDSQAGGKILLERVRIPRLPLEQAFQVLLADTEWEAVVESAQKVRIVPKGSVPVQDLLAPAAQAERFGFTLNGIVLDAKTGESLPNATVFIQGTQTGTFTNPDGYFTLLDVPSDTAILIIRYLGYRSTSFRLSPETDLQQAKFEVEPSDYSLETVVIAAEEDQMMQQKGVSHVSISPAQLASLPSLGEKDIFRSLQLLPGISGTNETTSGLYVRGGTPDQNLILLDGFTVYHVDHFYGFFSAFNAEAIKDVQLYKGGFGAQYGGRLSSVVELIGKNGNKNEFDMGVGISALSANLRLEAPIGENMTFFVAGRRSYTDIIQSGVFNKINDLVGPETPTNGNGPGPGGGRFGNVAEPKFYFYDLNAKLTYTPTEKDVLSLSFYNGQDNLDNSFDNSQSGFRGFGGGQQNVNFSSNTVDITNWGNWGLSGKWARQWGDRLYSNAVLAYSNYFSERERTSNTTIEVDSVRSFRNGLIEDNDVRNLSLRLDNRFQATPSNQLLFGIEINQQSVDYIYTQNDTLNLVDREDQGTTYAAYIQDEWKVIPDLTLSGGLRYTYYDLTQESFVEPRISFSYALSDKIQLKGAWGQYHQFTNRVVREDILQGSRDFWLLSNGEDVPIGASTHYIGGFSYESKGFLFDVEAYYKDLEGLTEFSQRIVRSFGRGRGPQAGAGAEAENFFFQGTGIAKGLEVLLQKKQGKYTGWISYTLSQIEHNFPELSDTPYPALHDQTHELKLVNSYQLGRWTFGATWVYSTGRPYTAPVGGYEITLLDGATEEYVHVGDKNSFRLPAYHRMDLSANYKLYFGNSPVTAGLSIFNLYGRKNIWYKEFEIVEGELLETNVQLLGFTPNFSLTFDLK
ncbi:MAG: TonB-dependent receptor [Bacteroidota bacterium]